MSNELPPLVLYHGGCWDGFCCAWLLKQLEPSAEFVPRSHGDPSPLPDVRDRLVYIVDFSFPREQMLEIIWRARHTWVLDHHKTAEQALRGLEVERAYILFDSSRSGAQLVWDELVPVTKWNLGVVPDGRRHWLVDYTADRDLWQHQLPQTLEINAWLRSQPLNFQLWDEFAAVVPGSADWDRWCAQGAGILKLQRTQIDHHVRVARAVRLGGYVGLAVNATVLSSEIAGELATLSSHTFGATFYIDVRHNIRKWQLRSAVEFDVGALAASLGGGGHLKAAGFEESADTPIPYA